MQTVKVTVKCELGEITDKIQFFECPKAEDLIEFIISCCTEKWNLDPNQDLYSLRFADSNFLVKDWNSIEDATKLKLTFSSSKMVSDILGTIHKPHG